MPAEWDQVIEVLKKQDLIPFLDIAYQGFGQGLEQDAYAIRALDQSGMNFIVSNSLLAFSNKPIISASEYRLVLKLN